LQKNRNRKYTPFPPDQVPSKIDIAMETGAYWNKAWREENLRRKSKDQQYYDNQQYNNDQFYQQYQQKQYKKYLDTLPPDETPSDVIKNRLAMRSNY